MMKVHDFVTNLSAKFDIIFPQLGYGGEIYIGPGGATFDQIFPLNMKKWTGKIKCENLVTDAYAGDLNRIEINIKLPGCIMS